MAQLAVELFVIPLAEQGSAGGFMPQRRLHQAEQHQRLLLIQRQQVGALLLGCGLRELSEILLRDRGAGGNRRQLHAG